MQEGGIEEGAGGKGLEADVDGLALTLAGVIRTAAFG